MTYSELCVEFCERVLKWEGCRPSLLRRHTIVAKGKKLRYTDLQAVADALSRAGFYEHPTIECTGYSFIARVKLGEEVYTAYGQGIPALVVVIAGLQAKGYELREFVVPDSNPLRRLFGWVRQERRINRLQFKLMKAKGFIREAYEEGQKNHEQDGMLMETSAYRNINLLDKE